MNKTYEDLSKHLPTAAQMAGMKLEFEQPYDVDPVYLRDRHGHELYRWDYTPTLGEVDDVVQRFLPQ